ncbi:MAG: hypothetical protein AAF699_01750 [Pseudomonadota bacterium]
MRVCSHKLNNQEGVALAIVVWFIAGMSLLVAGIVAHARVDNKLTQLHMAEAKTVAAGDGAIQLMMVDSMMAEVMQATMARSYRLGGQEVAVVLTPTSGLINLNSAPVPLLAALFLFTGELNEEASLQLAENIVAARRTGPFNRGVKLMALEDVLRIPGTSRSLLDAIRDLVVIGESSRGGIDWSKAPDEVLEVLAKADPARAESVRSRRAEAGGSNSLRPAASANPGANAGTLSGAYRADAIVRHGDQVWLRRRWLSIESSPASALPWHFTRTESPRVVRNRFRFRDEA